ncbi:MAG: DUF3810 domain-containing protein [Phocaeicola sp.]|nr:DUF3810 domain-containing protein [Phocaeicola sp.]
MRYLKTKYILFIRWSVLLSLLAFIIVSSFNAGVAEFYSRNLYPAISYIMSAIASLFTFSLDEWAIFVMAVLIIVLPVYWRKKRNKTWKSVLLGEVELILWIYVWFYIGWGINYYRESFFSRAGIVPAEYNETQFRQFVDSYIDDVNNSMLPAGVFAEMDKSYIRDEIKRSYSHLSSVYGLSKPHSFQHPKKLSFNFLYSGTGVLGFMGPFFSESHINMQISPLEYPFTYAHELSHLLGISNEAEANLWAYQACLHSSDRRIQYSGYFGLLQYVLINSSYLLDEDEYKEKILMKLNPEIIQQLKDNHKHWLDLYSPFWGKIQSAVYDMYLKGNRISSGQKNYVQVVGLLLSLPEQKVKFVSE